MTDAKTAWQEREIKMRELLRTLTDLLSQHVRAACETQMTGEMSINLNFRLGGVTQKYVVTKVQV